MKILQTEITHVHRRVVLLEYEIISDGFANRWQHEFVQVVEVAFCGVRLEQKKLADSFGRDERVQIQRSAFLAISSQDESSEFRERFLIRKLIQSNELN